MADKTKPIVPSIPIKPSKTIYYIQPSYSVTNIGLIIIVIGAFMFLIFKVLFTIVDWEGSKCKGSNFMLSPLLGKDSSKTFNQCVQSSLNDATADTTSNLYKKMDELTKAVNSLQTTTVASTTPPGTTDPKFTSNYNTLLGTINTIQTGLSKILGSVVLSSYMTNGVLQSSNTLENGDLSKLIKQYNAVGNKIGSPS